jgi:hypothetical protein
MGRTGSVRRYWSQGVSTSSLIQVTLTPASSQASSVSSTQLTPPGGITPRTPYSCPIRLRAARAAATPSSGLAPTGRRAPRYTCLPHSVRIGSNGCSPTP